MLNVSLIGMNPNNAHSAALYYLKAYANTNSEIKEHTNIHVDFYDALINPETNEIDFIVRKIYSRKPDLLCFSTYCWNIANIIKIADTFKRINPNLPIVLGGPEVSGRAAWYLQSYVGVIDFVIAGEGEIGFRDFLKFMLGSFKKEEVPNLVYLDHGSIRYNPIEAIQCLDDIPSIYTEEYLFSKDIGSSYYSFETKRGCQYNCSYCFHHGGYRNIRFFSLSRIFSDLDVILNSSLNYVWIIDPCFNEDEERAIEILEYIEKHNVNQIEFGFELRNETLSERFIIALSKISTIRFIAMGLQTLNQTALAAVNRAMDFEHFCFNLDCVKKHLSKDCRIHIDLIFGLPEDTLENYKESIDYCLNADTIIFTQPLKILPGTDLQINSQDLGIVEATYPPYEVLSNNTFTFEDMCQAKKINAVLNLYQQDPTIKKWLIMIKNLTKKSLANVFESFGNFLWEKNADEFFLNNREFSVGYLLKTVKQLLEECYSLQLPNYIISDDLINSRIQLDWGSIANLEFVD